MTNKVTASMTHVPETIENGMLLFVVPKENRPANDNYYIVSACPNPDGVSTATLVLTSLSNGSVYSVKSMKAVYENGKLQTTVQELQKHISEFDEWGLVESVTITTK